MLEAFIFTHLSAVYGLYYYHPLLLCVNVSMSTVMTTSPAHNENDNVITY